MKFWIVRTRNELARRVWQLRKSLKVPNALFFVFLLLALAGCSNVESLEYSNKNAEQKRLTLKFVDVSDATFAPSGEFLAIQGSSNFYVLPTRNLFDAFKTLTDYPARTGKIIGFLPSGKLIYSDRGEIFSLNAANAQVERLFDKTASTPLANKDFARKEYVIVSDDLIVTGDGNYDWGVGKGNIFRYDLSTKNVIKGPTIPAFWYASKSSDGRYVLYEHGAEANNNVELYDVSSNRNFAISKYFNFKKLFPSMKATDEVPIGWLANQNRFLALVEPNDEEQYTDNHTLVLFDVATKGIIWKTSLSHGLFPSSFQEIGDGRSLLCLDDGIHELSLLNGKIITFPGFKGTQCSVSPDRMEIAFIESNLLKVIGTAGGNERDLFELPSNWKHAEDYKGMGSRPPLWSPTGDSLIMFGQGQLLLVQH